LTALVCEIWGCSRGKQVKIYVAIIGAGVKKGIYARVLTKTNQEITVWNGSVDLQMYLET